MNSTVKVYTSEEIAACLDGFKGFPGFTGVSCTKCGGTANIPAFGARWFCAVKSPYTGGAWEYGDIYVYDIKSNARKVE